MDVIDKIDKGTQIYILNRRIEAMYSLYYSQKEEVIFKNIYPIEELKKIGIEKENIEKFVIIAGDIGKLLLKIDIYEYNEISKTEDWIVSTGTEKIKDKLEEVETYKDFQEKYEKFIDKIRDFKIIYSIILNFKLEANILFHKIDIIFSDILKMERKFLVLETQDLKNNYKELVLETQDLKNSYQKLINEQKEHDVKIIEIMGIFVSIVSLIMTNLSFFSNYESSNILAWIILILVVNITIIGGIIILILMIKFINSNVLDKNKSYDKKIKK